MKSIFSLVLDEGVAELIIVEWHNLSVTKWVSDVQVQMASMHCGPPISQAPALFS